MKKILPLLIFFVILLSPTISVASGFSQVYIRINNQSANEAISTTICAKPSDPSADTESKILVTFPSNFSISTNASNWIVNTSSLPQGSTPWPGIGSNAQSVSGKTVTISSSDLTNSNLYCFNLSSTASSNPAIAGNDLFGTIKTQNASNATIDTSNYAVSVQTSNHVNVTAGVDPSATDIDVLLESETPGTLFNQNQTINYKITYGSNTAGSIPLTLQASWSRGTIEGDVSPSVDILDYVVGSATNAYNSTPPVVDTTNRTITWTIASIPGNTTNQTVNFALRTNDSYKGTSLVDFTVSAYATSGTAITPDSNVDQTYQFLAPPENKGGPGDNLSDKRSDNGQSSQKFSFTDIKVRSISQDEASIYAKTSTKTKMKLTYGTSLFGQSNVIDISRLSIDNLFGLKNLLKDTTYYFRIYATDNFGIQISSDIFTFKTSSGPLVFKLNPKTLIATSNNNFIVNPFISEASGSFPTIVVPVDFVFEMQISTSNNSDILNLQAIVRDKNVLGLSSFDKNEANSTNSDFYQTQAGVFTTKLLSSKNPGQFEVYARVSDGNGNISEEKIADLKVLQKMQVFDTYKNPIENIRALLYLFDSKTKTFELISSKNFPIFNPVFSKTNGAYDLVLPYGKYKAKFSAIGYSDKNVIFNIGPDGNYPNVILDKSAFSLLNVAKYYFNGFLDSYNANKAYIKVYSESNRFLDLSYFIVTLIFLIVTILSFSARTHIPLVLIPYFFIHRIKLLFNKTKNNIIHGKIYDKESNLPISRVSVTVINSKKQTVATTLTNKLGEFYFLKPANDFKISVSKKDYLNLPPQRFDEKKPTIIYLAKDLSHTKYLIEEAILYLEGAFGLLLESFLLLSLFFEIYFLFSFGILKTLPLLIISILTIMLIFLFIYHPRKINTLE